MASIGDLDREGFKPSPVKVRQLNVIHRSAASGLPFCRLDVLTDAPSAPGVYAWVAAGTVRYVGDTVDLRSTVDGAHTGWPGEDQTEISAADAAKTDSVRVWLNALLNEALHRGLEVTWWWLPSDDARAQADRWIGAWRPAWNANVASATGGSPPPTEAAPKSARKVSAKPRSAAASPVKQTVARIVCPSCFLEVPAATRYCDDCEITVA